MSKIAEKLLKWYDKEGRDLPWRKTTDPYKILVSEIMLQQTQVSRGLIFYDRFLKEFPTWELLAKATNAKVIKAWSGLGYNRRALTLRDIAKHVVKNGLPKNEEEWKNLKGIGAYTAAAVSLFSYKQKTFPIDTNIRRFGARTLFGICYPLSDIDKELKEKGLTILTHDTRHDDVFQSIFDFANSYCLKIPLCNSCPLKNECKAYPLFKEGNVEVPKQMIKKGKEKIHRDKKYPDRIYRGRILKLVKENRTVNIDEIGLKIDKKFDIYLDKDWLLSMIKRMEKDQFLIMNKESISIQE